MNCKRQSPNFSDLARLSNAAQRGTAKARRRARIAALARWHPKRILLKVGTSQVGQRLKGKDPVRAGREVWQRSSAKRCANLTTQENHETITADNRAESAHEPSLETGSNDCANEDEGQEPVEMVPRLATHEETVTELWIQ